MKVSKIILGLFILIAAFFFIPPTAFCQTEKLGIISYTPPKGMKKSVQENVVGFSELNQTTGTFCIITLYGATVSSGTPTTDFTTGWNNLAVKNLNAKTNPETETQSADGWTIIAGASAVDSDGIKGAAFLTVISGFGKTVNILAVFNDQSYMSQIAAFVSGIDLDKTSIPDNPPTTANTAAYDSNGKLIIPLPTRQLTVADFAGEWGEDAKRLSTTYVYRSSGAYAGSDNLAFQSKMTITEKGGYFNDFFAIQNGKKILENTNGKISVNGRVFSIIQSSTQKFVIRGWLELPDMTIMILCGPLYDEDIARHLNNSEQGANLNNVWVRKK
ncbi:MAG: hypothetical protein K1X72_21070 [Pyrinomonadaceae bacterium]|nr:hypothetical protein [Pyrinomonadaceae bacterium]